ncbi:MAG TPA: glycosyltransferase family 39 protein [Thermoanaerobaculia bacterium]|jgi:hypothetical protein|nr:glycosyltransferase family 39 protein [Thermoanaerobaculia bacterium]
MPKRPRKTAPPARDRRSVRLIAIAIFAAAFAARVLFWQATPDRVWGWTAYMKADAPLWLEWARAIEVGSSFELGLPIHPPGAAYLVSLLWNGRPSGVDFVRFAWVLMGALVPLLTFLALERSFGVRVATVAGTWAALSSGLLVLSTSINNETPYLVLAIGSLWFVEDLLERPKTGRLALCSALNAVACLFRVEHLLFFVPALGFLAIGWLRRDGSRAVRLAAVSLLFFALPLLPWHLSAWRAIRRFNEQPRQLTPVEQHAVRGVEESLAGLRWSPEAIRARDRLPSFLRRTASAFVLATVAHRGGHEVRGEDFRILEQAFGYRPRRLDRHPFVSSYGPLNFYLANNPASTGGFDRSPLEQPPPLGGGAASYPRALVQGLPPGDLSFVYPPHLRLFNEGYSLGWKWIRGNPKEFARLAAGKLSIFWSGAAMGFTGWNLPLGLSGTRRAVDMVSPEGGFAAAWRLAVAAACLAGVVFARRQPALTPWLLFFASKVVVTILFFGYVRQGATVVPVVALLLGVALERWIPARPLLLAVPVLALGVTLEAARFVSKPHVRIDGVIVGDQDPLPPDDHDAHRVEVRLR